MRCPTCHRRVRSPGVCPNDQTSIVSEDTAILVQAPKGDFQVNGLKGQGAFGTVYSVRMASGLDAALKVGRKSDALRYAREAEALKRLPPFVAPELYGINTSGESPYLVMEAIAGVTLASKIDLRPGDGRFHAKEAMSLFVAIVEAAAEAHDAGIVHGDLKPENIMIRPDGTAALIDFQTACGPALAHLPVDLSPGQRFGTLHYMAPEQCVDAARADASADVYALGIIFYELLCGRPPFVGDAADVREAHLARKVPELRHSEILGLSRFFERCLAKNPSVRSQNARELLTIVQALSVDESKAPWIDRPASVTTLTRPGATREFVLLGLARPQSIVEVEAILRPFGGTIARIFPDRLVAMFPDDLHLDEQFKSACAAAKGCREQGVAMGQVIHVASLRCRPGRSLLHVSGEALIDLNAWFLANAVELHLTEAAKRLFGDVAPLETMVSQRHKHGEIELPLEGRDEELESCLIQMRSLLIDGRASLTVLTGDDGVGRTRFAKALVQRFGDLPIDVKWVYVPNPDAEVLSDGDRSVSQVLESMDRSSDRHPVAIVIDDAHFLTSAEIDRIEQLTLADRGIAVHFCLIARDTLLAARPRLGDRCAHSNRLTLLPLSQTASKVLLRHALRAREFVAEDTIDRLVALSQGFPLAMIEFIRSLQREDLQSLSSGHSERSLHLDGLKRDPVASIFAHSAKKTLSRLPQLLQRFAFACAIHSHVLNRERLEACIRELDEGDRQLATLDLDVALGRLAKAELLTARGGGDYVFRSLAQRRAIESLAPGATSRIDHRAAFMALGGPSGSAASDLRAWTTHAVMAGFHESAAAGSLSLGDEARSQHSDVEAEAQYTAALRHCADGLLHSRQLALSGRAQARMRLQRFRDAQSDLQAARRVAQLRADVEGETNLVLQEAMVCDWLEDVDAAQQLVLDARGKVDAIDSAETRVRVDLAVGRSMVREGRYVESAIWLGDVAADAREVGDHESEIIAMMMQASALCLCASLDRSEEVFAQALSMASLRFDPLHRAAIYINRVLLWIRKGEPNKALDDLRSAVQLARFQGHAQLERWASYNTAEFLHWTGDHQAALPLAQRAFDLGVDFFAEHPVATDALLLARIHGSLNERSKVARLLEWVTCHVPAERMSAVGLIHVRYLKLCDRSVFAKEVSTSAWAELIDDANCAMTDDEFLELVHQALTYEQNRCQATLRARWLSLIRQRDHSAPTWRLRLDRLSSL